MAQEKQEKRKLTDEEKNPSGYFSSPVGHIRDRIVIHESLRIPKAGQFISLNGYPFLAKPGVEIDIPRPVRLMLDTLTESEVVVGEDEKTYTRDIPRFPYRLIAEGVNVPKGTVAPGNQAPSAAVISKANDVNEWVDSDRAPKE